MTLFSYGSITPLFSFLLQAETAPAFNWSPHKLWEDTSAAGLAVMLVLLLMSIYSLAVMFERYLTFKGASRQSREFVPKVSEMLKTSHLSEALQLSREYKKSHLAVVVNSGLQELTTTSGKNPLRKAKRALRT